MPLSGGVPIALAANPETTPDEAVFP